jgi:hypothetical protein
VIDREKIKMKKFLLATVAVGLCLGTAAASAQQKQLFPDAPVMMPPWSWVDGYAHNYPDPGPNWISPGWVYEPYLACKGNDCVVADPSGTPLNIHSYNRNAPIVGTILNGTPVIIVNKVGSYVQIAVNSYECKISQDVNGSIYCSVAGKSK